MAQKDDLLGRVEYRRARDKRIRWAVYKTSVGEYTGTPVAEGDQTVRFRASSRLSYARALIVLLSHARSSAREFTFGPLNTTALEDQGLLVSGPDAESWADDLLKSVPGLHRSDE